MTTPTSPSELSLSSSVREMTILNPTNCIIGDHGVMIINKQVSIPLKWKRPSETQAGWAKGAVGRKDELHDLHERLSTKQDTVVVSTGTTAAIQGQPAIGKSTLAAMYAGQHANEYLGGVIWLQLGPSYRTADSVNGLIQRIAAYAYEADPQSGEMLKNYVFSGETTKMLLAGHGPILVIIDDVWYRAPLEELRQAFPDEATIIMTTRDYDIALALDEKRGEQSLLALDVLSPDDAQVLILQALPSLSAASVKKLMMGLDCHAYALVLAAGTINRQRRTRNADQVIVEILGRMSHGTGLGDLPSPKREEQERTRKFQEVLRYSYDHLSTSFENGEVYQRYFRALGAFAEGASFRTEAAIGIWNIENAFEVLIEFQNLGLVRLVADVSMEVSRWAQHAVLRSFALSLQEAEEQKTFALHHTLAYLTMMRAADKAGRFFVMTPDLPQIRHALEWSATQAVNLAQNLLGETANLLKSRNLGEEYLMWATLILGNLAQNGTLQQIGAGLMTKGNALQAAATMGQRATRLNEALACYQEALDKQRGVPFAYAVTLNNMANLLRDLAELPGQDRPARLNEALACYREALDNLRDVPLDYAATLNNMANLLRDLAGLPGQDRPARLNEALACYREALDKRREVPLDYAQTLNNMALLLRDLAGLPGQDRPARLNEALVCFQEALDNLRDVPLTYAVTLNNMAIVLRDLAGLPGQDRPARLNEALACCQEALDKQSDVPLDYAITLNSMANVLRDLAGLPDQDRLARLNEALACYREALDKRREVPLAYAQTLNNMAVLLRDLAGLPGQDRPARLNEALACYREALDKQRDVPLAYAATLNNMANVLSNLAELPGQDRLARLNEALAYYREALSKRRDVPLAYAATLNNMAVLLRDLAGLPGQDRLARLNEALACYREALDHQREVPLAYAQTLNNMANVLSDLAELPAQDRAARLKEALAHIHTALQIFVQSQQVQYLVVGQNVLRALIVKMGGQWFRTCWTTIAPAEPYPDLSEEELFQEFISQEDIHSDAEFQGRLTSDDTFRQRLEDVLSLATDKPQANTRQEIDEDTLNRLQALANLLVEWVQTPDLEVSLAYLRQHETDLLSDEAEFALQMLIQANNGNQNLQGHLAILRACRAEGIDKVYQRIDETGQAE